MKKRSSFAAGMLTMALLFGLVGTAYAAYQKQATLNYQDIKITLNGELVTPKDGAGNIVEPFTIDGTTYLPVRAIANAMGLEVNWNGATNTVEIATPVVGEKNYEVHDCYRDFSVPSLENIVGYEALIDMYLLEEGDSVLYTYELKNFHVAEGVNFAEEYFVLLKQYGFGRQKSEDGKVYFKNKLTGITVALYMPDDYHFCVLVMNVPEMQKPGYTEEKQPSQDPVKTPQPTPEPTEVPKPTKEDEREARYKAYREEYDSVKEDYGAKITDLENEKRNYKQSKFQEFVQRGLDTYRAGIDSQKLADQEYDSKILDLKTEMQEALDQLKIKYGL